MLVAPTNPTTDGANLFLLAYGHSQPSRFAPDTRLRFRDESLLSSRDAAIEICARLAEASRSDVPLIVGVGIVERLPI